MTKLLRRIFKKCWWRLPKSARKDLNKAVHKLHTDLDVNPCWKENWKKFLQHDYPWYGILELNQFKLMQMLAHYKSSDPDNYLIGRIDDIIALGKNILAHDTYENCEEWESVKWEKANLIPILLIYENLGEVKEKG